MVLHIVKRLLTKEQRHIMQQSSLFNSARTTRHTYVKTKTDLNRPFALHKEPQMDHKSTCNTQNHTPLENTFYIEHRGMIFERNKLNFIQSTERHYQEDKKEKPDCQKNHYKRHYLGCYPNDAK